MKHSSATANGKIILSGEYAVVFGYPGIAVPAPIGMQVLFEETDERSLQWDGIPDTWKEYTESIIDHCGELGGKVNGRITVKNDLPLGKGMGSSTALVIAVARCLLGNDCKAQALEIENRMNPGHSGVDFAVIWENAPILFKKNEDPKIIDLKSSLLRGALLIDTGTPNETTPELVAWVKGREQELMPHLETIGECTERLQKLVTLSPVEVPQALRSIIRRHHRAQAALGVVPATVQELIAAIEGSGGAGKVLGAGAKTGGGGIVLAIGNKDFKQNGKWKMVGESLLKFNFQFSIYHLPLNTYGYRNLHSQHRLH